MKLAIETYPVGDGYGYRIYVDDRAIIEQPHPPALAGTHTMTETQAEAFAQLVIAKLSNQRTPDEEQRLQALGARCMMGFALTDTEMQELLALDAKGNPTISLAEACAIMGG